jgi:6,7-dimethyl-8-ribityllumazine synthase
MTELPAVRTSDEEQPEPPEEKAEEQEQEQEQEQEHAPGRFDVPSGYKVMTGSRGGGRRAVAVVVAKFNGDVTSRLLQRALDALDEAGVEREAVTIVPVPGAFELPLAAIALAKSRKYACIVALGCVIRGETTHSEYVAGEAASGLQLAAIETGVPVSFGVLTTDSIEQAEARVERAADAVRGALEMAGIFEALRAAR